MDPLDFFCALRTGGFGWSEVVSSNGTKEIGLSSRDGSWVCYSETSGAHHVRQGGPRQLWDEVEEVFGLWQDLGEPTQERFGLTVTPMQQHRVWLDDPTGLSWPLP